MTCPQCNAELPESATFCHTCGSPARSATFSYLPPGTPAWPATVPPMPLAVAGATTQAAKELEGGRRAAIKPLTARPKRSLRSVLIITALFILVPLVAIGATLGTLWFNGEIPIKAANASLVVPTQAPQTPAASGTLTPTAPATQSNKLPTPASFQMIISPEAGITLKYSIEWVKDAPQTSSSGVVLAFHPQQKNGIYLFLQRYSAGTSATLTSTNDVNQGNLSAFQNVQGVHNFKIIASAAPQITVGGIQWNIRDATFSSSQGLIYHLTTIAVQHNQLYYDVLFYAPAVAYNEAAQKYFQPMLDSFQFQS